MGSFCALGTVTGVSKAVLVLPTLEECYRSHFSPSQDSEVQKGHPVQVEAGCLPGLLSEICAPSTELPSAPAPLWPVTAARTAFQCVLQRALPERLHSCFLAEWS